MIVKGENLMLSKIKLTTGLESIFLGIVILLTLRGVSYIPLASIILLFVYMVIYINKTKRIKISFNKGISIFYWMISYILYAIMISTISFLTGKLQTIDVLKSTLLGSYLFLGAFSFIRLTYVDLLGILQIIKCFGVFCSIYGIFEYVTKTNITFVFLSDITKLYLSTGDRIMTFFSHPIIYSCFLVFVLLILFYIPFKIKELDYVAKALIIINILLTKTRSSFIALLILSIIFLIKAKNIKRFKKQMVVRTIVLCVVLFMVIAIFFRNSMAEIFDDVYKRMRSLTLENQEIRVEILYGYFRYFISSPSSFSVVFGAGAGYSTQFVQALNIYNGWWNTTTDNMFITILLNFGFIGLLPFILLIKKAFYSYNRIQDPMKNIGFAFILFIMMTSFTFESFGWPIIIYLFVLSLMLISKESNIE